MWEKIKKLTDIALIAGFLGFIYIVSVMTYTGQVQRVIEDTKFNFASYKQLSSRFEGVLQRNLYKRYGFINLNGRVARVLRINTLNQRQKLANGFLTGLERVRDVHESAESVIELNRFLADRNIPFIYLLAPGKNSIYDVQFAPGYGDDSKQNITNMINALNAAGIKTLNMDAWFRKNNWHMKDVFFKTDHHWMPQAGIASARCTMEFLQQLGMAEYDEEKLQDKNYKIQVLKNWFLGSHGRRTGRYYAGLDDISVYYPKFKTDYFYAGLPKDSTNWKYSNSLLNTDYIKKKDLFGSDPYCIYLHGTFGQHITYNSKALNKKKVLITGDSFFRVWQYFLATQFQETRGIDLRRYTDGTFAQYVEEFKPDIVIMCLNEGGTTSKEFNTFGVKDYLSALNKPLGSIQELDSMELQAEGNNSNFEVVCSNLEPNQAYTLTIDSTELSGVKNSFIQMTLQNLSENKAIYNRYFNANSGKTQKWIFTTPVKVEDTYGIYLYAGVKGHTANISVKIEDLRLQKGIRED